MQKDQLFCPICLANNKRFNLQDFLQIKPLGILSSVTMLRYLGHLMPVLNDILK